jgi:hypothetical protein
MIISIIFCLCACEKSNEVTTKEGNTDIEIWTDKETGVQYVIYDKSGGYSGMGGITPRFNTDGTLYVVSTENNEHCEHCGQALLRKEDEGKRKR